MSQFHKSIASITALDDLSGKNTPVHRLNPLVKLIVTGVYLVLVISFPSDEVSGLIPYIFYPILMMAFGDIPAKPLFGRLLPALPFALFGGLSNLIFDRAPVMRLGRLVVTGGMVSFLSIMLKTAFTVMAVLVFIATTNRKDILNVLVGFKLPPVFVLQLTMTFRYLEVLLEEASSMYHAYLLRSPGRKGIRLSHAGTFLGQLLLRSFDRAERIYHAMRCRGFEGNIRFSGQDKMGAGSLLYLAVATAVLITMRFVNFSVLAGRLFMTGELACQFILFV